MLVCISRANQAKFRQLLKTWNKQAHKQTHKQTHTHTHTHTHKLTLNLTRNRQIVLEFVFCSSPQSLLTYGVWVCVVVCVCVGVCVYVYGACVCVCVCVCVWSSSSSSSILIKFENRPIKVLITKCFLQPNIICKHSYLILKFFDCIRANEFSKILKLDALEVIKWSCVCVCVCTTQYFCEFV